MQKCALNCISFKTEWNQDTFVSWKQVRTLLKTFMAPQDCKFIINKLANNISKKQSIDHKLSISANDCKFYKQLTGNDDEIWSTKVATVFVQKQWMQYLLPSGFCIVCIDSNVVLKSTHCKPKVAKRKLFSQSFAKPSNKKFCVIVQEQVDASPTSVHPRQDEDIDAIFGSQEALTNVETEQACKRCLHLESVINNTVTKLKEELEHYKKFK